MSSVPRTSLHTLPYSARNSKLLGFSKNFSVKGQEKQFTYSPLLNNPTTSSLVPVRPMNEVLTKLVPRAGCFFVRRAEYRDVTAGNSGPSGSHSLLAGYARPRAGSSTTVGPTLFDDDDTNNRSSAAVKDVLRYGRQIRSGLVGNNLRLGKLLPPGVPMLALSAIAPDHESVQRELALQISPDSSAQPLVDEQESEPGT